MENLYNVIVSLNKTRKPYIGIEYLYTFKRRQKDNKIYEAESFLPVCYCTICIAIDTFFSGGFAEIGCIDMNLRKANCNNDMVLIKM